LRPPPLPDPPTAVPTGANYSLVALTIRVDSAARVDDLVAAVRSIEPQLPLIVRLVDDAYVSRHADVLLATRVIGGFSMFAFAIAVAGLYAVMTFLVTSRIREIGVRIALGADRRAVVGFVLRSSLGVVLTGTAIGLAAAAAGSRWLNSQLFGVSGVDAPTYLAVAAVAIAASLLAIWHPAWRAAHVDPVVALRS
jgi:ABC-type antimicrobial peptide transport system permease subunit